MSEHVTPFGFGLERLMSVSRDKRLALSYGSSIAFMLLLWVMGAPAWAAIAIGNIVFTLDEILLVLAAGYVRSMKDPRA